MRYESDLKESWIKAHVEQSHAFWGSGITVEERYQIQLRRMAQVGPERFHFSGLVDGDGQLTASLKRYYFYLWAEGRERKCVGLGAIFTPPTHRKQGLAELLIRTVLKESFKERGCLTSVLYSDIGVDYYAKQGFRPIAAEGWKIAAEALPAGSPFPLVPTSNRAELVARFDRHARRFPLYTVRDEKSWALFHEMNGAGQTYLLPDGGFLTLSMGPDFVWVDEWGGPAEQEASVWATVREVALKAGKSEARGWWLPHYEQLKAERTPRQRAVPMLTWLDGDRPEIPSNAYFASVDHF